MCGYIYFNMRSCMQMKKYSGSFLLPQKKIYQGLPVAAYEHAKIYTAPYYTVCHFMAANSLKSFSVPAHNTMLTGKGTN